METALLQCRGHAREVDGALVDDEVVCKTFAHRLMSGNNDTREQVANNAEQTDQDVQNGKESDCWAVGRFQRHFGDNGVIC